MKIGKQLKGKEELKDAEFAVLFQAMIEGVMTLGGAKEGEKTFLDALCPAQRAYAEHVDEGRQEPCNVLSLLQEKVWRKLK